MSRIRKQFTKEEKLQIVEMSLEPNTTLTSLASQFGVHPNTIYKWRREYTDYSSNAFPGSGYKLLSDEQREMERLKKELREKTLEVEILKKAVGIFSSPNKKDLLS